MALTGLAWVAALALAAVGGPYGAGTAAVQAVAAVAGDRRSAWPCCASGASIEGLAIVVAAVALLIPDAGRVAGPGRGLDGRGHRRRPSSPGPTRRPFGEAR